MCLNLLTTVMTASVWFLNNKSFGVVQIYVETFSLIFIATQIFVDPNSIAHIIMPYRLPQLRQFGMTKSLN